MTPRRAGAAALAAALALGLAEGCSSGTGPSPGAGPTGSPGGSAQAGGEVRLVPGQVVVADSLAVSPDGRWVAAGCGSDLCRWSTTDGALDERWPDGPRVAWSPAGDLVATPGDQTGGRASVLLLDGDGDQVARLAGHEVEPAEDAVGTGVRALAFSPDGLLLASAGTDGTVRLWSVPGGDPAGLLETGGTAPDSLAFSPDGDRLAVAAAEAPVEVWDTATAERAGTLDAGPQQAVAWSADGLLATAGDGVRLWDGATLRPQAALPVRVAGRVAGHQLAFSPDGGTLAITQVDRPGVLLWTPGDAETQTLAGHEEAPRAVAWAPGGGTVYTVSGSEGMLAWDVASGEVRRFEVPLE